MKLYFGNAVTTATTLMILALLGYIGVSVWNRGNIACWGRRTLLLLVFGLGVCCFAAARDGLDKTMQHTIDGSGAIAVPIVTFGNRAFDNSLIELRNILEAHGFHTIAAAAFACEHSFSTTLGAGRPDADDLAEAATFAHAVTGKLAALAALDTLPAPIAVDGDAEAGYYQPRDRHGVFIDIRKVKPLTSDACDQCGLCAAACPMGAIDPSDVTKVPGICIKCGACIKKCPQSAKYYDDTGYLYHKEELEAMYGVRRAANSFYLSF